MKYIKILLITLSIFAVTQAQAAVSPIGLSLFPPVQLPPADFTITGVRINLIWGDHHNVYGLDVGTIANSTLQNVAGIQAVGGVNYNRGTAHIALLQVAGIANVNLQQLTLVGVQVALFNSNQGEASVYGLQVGGANLSAHTKLVGIQAGLYNKANEVYGFQLGLINMAGNLHGLQVGLLNFNDRGLFAVAPILNVGF